MRRTISILASASAVALIAAAPASAQSTAPAAPADPAVTAQTNAADPAPTEEADDSETIVVTGLRRSLQSARNIKRNSEQQVDAIVAEDIGKLPDIAVSETAARIPGVQVNRRFGEADAVLVRGLPDFTTTYNGREIFTAESRVVALQDFPSANIAALEVFKSATADLVEAGLAGQVNVRSRRPFDFKGLEVAGSIWGLRTLAAGKWTPNVNLLVSNRWDLKDGGELGLMLNYSRTQLKYLDSEISNTDFIAPGPNGTQFPDIQRLYYPSGDRVRPSLNGAIQWRVNPNVVIYAEGLWQGFRDKIQTRLWEQPLYGGSSYTNLVQRTGRNTLSSGTVNNPALAVGFQGGTFNTTDTYQYALGGSWDAGRLKLTTDMAWTTSEFNGSTASVDFAVRDGTGYSVDFNNEVPEFTVRNFDASNPANYVFRGFYEEDQQSKGTSYQTRLDAEYETGMVFLPRLQAGIRYTNRDAERRFGNRYRENRFLQIPISQVPLDYQLFRGGFRGTDIQSGFTTFLSPTYDSIRDNRRALRQLVINNPFGFSFGTWSTDVPPPNVTDGYTADDKTVAGYVQANYKLGEIIDGVIGLRAVKTDSSVQGFTRLPGDVFNQVDVGNKYTDYLPNASIRIRPIDNVQLRLAATQTRTKPTFADLNPSSNLGPRIGTCTPGGTSTTSNVFDCRREGGGGNPFLKPFTSNNYDASLEYYFTPTGVIAGAVFRRDLDGFIQRRELRYVDPVLGPLVLNAPANAGKGRIDGAELQFSSFFDFEFLPEFLRSFGAQANMTYLDTDIEDPNSQIGNRRIYGVSKYTYNLVGMFERGGLSARLSYNKRSRTLETIQIRNGNDPTRFEGDRYIEYGRPAGRLDLSTSYTFNDKLTLFADWTNILNNPYRQDFSSARNGAARSDYVRFLRFEEQTISFGVRARL